MASSTAYLAIQQSTSRIDLTEYTVPARAKDLQVRITASGTVVPVQSVNVSPKNAGVLRELRVEQGDRVQEGQVIARMDNSDIQAQMIQAQAQLDQAQAQLDRTRVGSRPEEIAQARARLMQAQAQLAEARAGSRTQEIAQAQAQVEAARARMILTNQRVERYQYLVAQGAESRDRLDELIADDRSARANLLEAQKRLDLLQSGTRPEEIARAEAAVAEARQALQQAVIGSRPEDIAAAEATLMEAQGRLRAVEVQLNDTIIRAPFSGTITQKFASEGAFVTPTTSASSTTSATSTSIVAIARGLEVLAQVPEVDISKIRPGQTVEINADAYPDQIFKGRVRLISPEAVVEQSVTSFQVRVDILTGLDQLRSGMNADLTFLGNQQENALVVPTVAIATEKGQTGVYIPGNNNKPEFQPVTIGSSFQDQTQVLSGIEPGQAVFINFPDKLKPKTEAN